MKIKFTITLSLLVLVLFGSLAQNQWTGAVSSDFSDLDNWDPIDPAVAVSLANWKECRIGQTDTASVCSSTHTLVIRMEDGGDLTVKDNILYADKLYVDKDNSSNVTIKDGGIMSIRNSNALIQGGTITILDGGAFECKSSIWFAWGRWDGDNATFNLFGGTTDFTRFVPWRNGFEANSSKIVFRGGGVGTFAAETASSWATSGNLLPAEGSLLTYDANEPTRMSSIDFTLPEDTTVITGPYTVPDYFEMHSRGDIAYSSTLAITQTPVVGTQLAEGSKYDIVVNAVDAFANVILDTIQVTVGDIATDIAPHKDELPFVKMTTASGLLYLNASCPLNVTVYTLSGQTVKSLNASEGVTNLKLSSGIYIVKCINEGKIITQKIGVK